MAHGRQREQWDHTSLIVATLMNTRFGVKKLVSPEDVHPIRKRKRKEELMKVPLKELRSVLVGPGKSK